MNVPKANPVEVAKQGNCKAIKFLIDNSLKGQGISSQVILKDNCLQIMLDGDPLPDSDKVGDFVYKGIANLAIPSIDSLRVYGRKAGSKSPDWIKKYQFVQESIPKTLSIDITTDKQVSISEPPLGTSNGNQNDLDEEVFRLECFGEGGSLVVTNKEIIFKRNGGLLSSHKKGEKLIPYIDIVSFQYQKSGAFSPGYIYFQIADDPASISYFTAAGHENAIIFNDGNSKLFDEAYKYLIDKVCFNNILDSETNEKASKDNIFVGASGTLILTKDGVILKRTGGLFSFHAAGEKHILYRNITAVQLKPVNLTVGFIQFSFQGGRESLGRAVDAVSDENTITFRSQDEEKEFRRAKEIIEQRMREATEPRPQASGGSDLDQLEKLASLRDKGIITEDEFQAKKKKILGL